jgi:HEAT repeats
MDGQTYVAIYLKDARQGSYTSAFFGLMEAPFDVVPELIKTYQASENADIRSFLLNVIWEHRQPAIIPFLSKALYDSDDSIWKEALNGLVALGSDDAVAALNSALIRDFKNQKDRDYFLAWLTEAIEQAKEVSSDALRNIRRSLSN